MRVFTCILLVLTLLAVGVLGYCYFGAQMKIEGVYASVFPASEALGTYNEIKDQLAYGTFMGDIFHDAELLSENDFMFLTLTVRMSNTGFFPMDWLRIEITPLADDVLQLAANRTPSLNARNRGDFAATVLTRAGSDTARPVRVTYYVFGKPLSAEFVM